MTMKAAKCLLFLVLSGTVTTASAQISKDAYKKRSEMMGLNKKLQSEKVSKASRQQAKEMKKDGWKVAPGALTLEQQILTSSPQKPLFYNCLINKIL